VVIYGSGQQQTQEYNVAGHIGREHMTQSQKADSIHQPATNVSTNSKGGTGGDASDEAFSSFAALIVRFISVVF
jgi:hypothetical protein